MVADRGAPCAAHPGRSGLPASADTSHGDREAGIVRVYTLPDFTIVPRRAFREQVVLIFRPCEQAPIRRSGGPSSSCLQRAADRDLAKERIPCRSDDRSSRGSLFILLGETSSPISCRQHKTRAVVRRVRHDGAGLAWPSVGLNPARRRPRPSPSSPHEWGLRQLTVSIVVQVSARDHPPI